MKKKATSSIYYISYLSAFFCLVTSYYIRSQNSSALTELTFGQSFKPNNKHEYYSNIKGYDGYSYYGIFADFKYGYEEIEYYSSKIYKQVIEKARYGIYKIDSNLNFVGENYFVLHKNLRSREFENLLVFFDTIYLFYSEKKLNETELYVQKINGKTLERIGEEKLLITKKDLKGNYTKFKFMHSPKRKKLLIISTTHVLISKSIRLDFRVYDNGLKQEWQREEFVAYNYQSPKDFKYIIDDYGNVHLMTLIYEIKVVSNFLTSQSLKNEYLIISLTNNGTSLFQYNILIPNMFIRQPMLQVGLDGGVACVGFFSDEISSKSRLGVFSAFVLKNESNVRIRTYDFSKHLMEKFFLSTNKNNENRLYSFNSKNFVPRSNGSFIYISEQVYDQSYDCNNDVIIMSFNQFGELIWQNVINKRQSRSGSASISISAPFNKEGIILLYNDNIKNDFEPAYFKNKKGFVHPLPSNLIAARVDKYGNINYEILHQRLKRKTPIPLVSESYGMLDGQIIFMLSSKYKKQFMKIKFEND